MKIITEELKREIIDFYKSKPMSYSVVAEKFNFCLPTISKILKDIPKYTKTQIFNPSLDESFFHDINREDKAYFLGLIISDGNVYDPNEKQHIGKHTGSKWTSITLDESDEYMLDKFRECVGGSNFIASDGRGSSYYAIRSNRMADDLYRYGIVPRKSFITRFPFEVDEKWYSHIFRGIIDGDGSIDAHQKYTAKDNRNRFKHKISCCGSHRLMQEMCDYISNKFDFQNKINVYDYNNRILSEFKVCNIHDMFIFGQWLYKDATIYLKRKRSQYDKFVEHYKLTEDNVNDFDIHEFKKKYIHD